MNGIVFKLFKLFIVESYDYVGWTKIQETYLDKLDGKLGSHSEFFNLLSLAEDILRVPEMKLLREFGKFCFLYLLANSSMSKPDKEEVADVFFYSDPLLNLKIKKLDDLEHLGWEIDGELKFESDNDESQGERSIFCSFVDGFLREGDKYYGPHISLDHLQSTPGKFDACKITVLVNNKQ